MSFAPLVRPAERAVCLLGAVAGGLSQTFQRTIADAVAIRERKFAFAVKTRKPEMNPERFIPGGGLIAVIKPENRFLVYYSIT